MDDDLIAAAQRGDQHAFRALMDRYARVTWRTAFVLLRNHSLAEDVVQDVWLRIWQALPAFQIGRPLRPWLLAIVANRCRTLTRRAVPTVSLDDPDDDRAQAVAALEDVALLYLRHEADAEVRDALVLLPVEQCAVLELRYFADLDLAEIAEVLHLPLGTVKSRLHRGHQALRQKLRPTHSQEVPHE